MSSKVAIITGAASGIGKHFAHSLIANDDEYCLVLADINEACLKDEFTPGERVRLYKLDIRSVDQWHHIVEDTLKSFNRIDYLFNIAGGGKPGYLLDQKLEDVDFLIDTNLKGTIYGMMIVAEQMAKQGTGHIINIASLAGVGPTPGNALYCAAKHGIRAVSLAAALKLKEKGVYVTVICPDLVDTPVLERNLRHHNEDAALLFSGSKRILTVVDLEKAIFKAMRDRPLEIDVPRWRGWLAKLNSLFPQLIFVLYEPLKRKGMRRMEELRQQRLESRKNELGQM